jgi:hypothetical protein
MAHYTCPDCGIVSREVRSQAEADQLLTTHQTHFCRPRPVRPAVQQATNPTATRRGGGR